MMHCLIFNDNQYDTIRSAGAYKFATTMKQNGWKVNVIDFISYWTDEELFAYLKNIVTDETMFFGFSNSFMYPASLQSLIKKIKNLYPLKKIFVGGNRPFYDDLMADLYIFGYSEIAIPIILDYYFGNGEAPKMKPLFDGYFINATVDYVAAKLDDYIITYQDDDYIIPYESAVIELSRGCRFKCKYCDFPFVGYKNDTTEEKKFIKRELQENFDRWGIRNYICADNTLNDRTSKLKSLAEVVNELKFEVNFAAFIRHDLLIAHPDQLKYLAEARVWGQFYGIETFTHETGKLVGKGLDPERVKDLLLHIKEYMFSQINIYRGTCSMIAGLPKEKPIDWEKSVEWYHTYWKDESSKWWFLNIYIEDVMGHIPEIDESQINSDWINLGYRAMVKDNYRNLGTINWENDYTNILEAERWYNKQKNWENEYGKPDCFQIMPYVDLFSEKDLLSLTYKNLLELDWYGKHSIPTYKELKLCDSYQRLTPSNG